MQRLLFLRRRTVHLADCAPPHGEGASLVDGNISKTSLFVRDCVHTLLSCHPQKYLLGNAPPESEHREKFYADV